MPPFIPFGEARHTPMTAPVLVQWRPRQFLFIVALQLVHAQRGADVFVERMEVVNGLVTHYDKPKPIQDTAARFVAHTHVPMQASNGWEDWDEGSEASNDQGDLECVRRAEETVRQSKSMKEFLELGEEGQLLLHNILLLHNNLHHASR
jgi:hypothetical protein